MKRSSIMKKASITILTALATSFVCLVGNSLLELNTLKARVDIISLKDEEISRTLTDIRKNIIAIHWYLIKRQNVEVPFDKIISKKHK